MGACRRSRVARNGSPIARSRSGWCAVSYTLHGWADYGFTCTVGIGMVSAVTCAGCAAVRSRWLGGGARRPMPRLGSRASRSSSCTRSCGACAATVRAWGRQLDVSVSPGLPRTVGSVGLRPASSATAGIRARCSLLSRSIGFDGVTVLPGHRNATSATNVGTVPHGRRSICSRPGSMVSWSLLSTMLSGRFSPIGVWLGRLPGTRCSSHGSRSPGENSHRARCPRVEQTRSGGRPRT